MRIIAPDGQPFLTYVELVEAWEAERLRAQAADQRAETEHQRAENRAPVRRTPCARLRELGEQLD